MTPEELLNLVNIIPQIAIAVLFAVFVREERRANQEAARTVMDDWSKWMEKQESLWRGFIDDQRVAQNAAIARLAEEIKGVSNLIAINNSLIQNHDNFVKEHWIKK